MVREIFKMRIHPRLACGIYCVIILSIEFLISKIFNIKISLEFQFFFSIIVVIGCIPVNKYFTKLYDGEDLLDETFKDNPSEDKK